MEMGMDSLSSYHLNPPLSSSLGGQQAFTFSSSSYYFYPPYAAMVDNNSRRDAGVEPTAPPASCQRPRSAAARKDRHSKICTAGGMRVRRMRLSLNVARRFFSLQDKLGFDKPSKTVQWLLDMSAVGIHHLAASMSMSMSEEDRSGSVLLDGNDHLMATDAETNNFKLPVPDKGRRRAGTGRRSSNGVPARLPDKESRARARQRARERTVQRNRLRSSSVPAVAASEEAPAPAPAPVPMRQVILPATPSYEEQEPWELGGVVFAKPRHRY